MNRQRVKRYIANIKITEIGECEICGFNVVLEGHHIISPINEDGSYNEDADDPANIVVLCPNHHTMIHKGIIRVERDEAGVLEVMRIK